MLAYQCVFLQISKYTHYLALFWENQLSLQKGPGPREKSRYLVGQQRKTAILLKVLKIAILESSLPHYDPKKWKFIPKLIQTWF